jgi:hypothetical protein
MADPINFLQNATRSAATRLKLASLFSLLLEIIFSVTLLSKLGQIFIWINPFKIIHEYIQEQYSI